MPPPIDVRSLSGSSVVYSSRERGYFPVIQRTGPNEAVAVIRGGAGHIGLEGRLELIRTGDRGRTWSEPEVVADSKWDDRNPSIGQARDGTLALAYHHQGNYDEEGSLRRGDRVDTLVKLSHDRGLSWSDPRPLNYEELRGRSPYGRMIVAGKHLLMPIYGPRMGVRRDRWDKSASYVLRSKDSGATWDDPSEVATEMNETSFLSLPDGRLLSILRSERDHPASIYTSLSDDEGYTWTEPMRVTGDSEHPGDAVLMSNGWLLMVYGHRHPPFGVQGMVSTDGGSTWERDNRLLFADDRPGGDCGYPSVTLFADGTVNVIYYSAGDHMDSRRLDGAFSKVVIFDEDVLITALKKNGVR